MELKAAGHWKDDPGDDEILAKAHEEGRILVTLDKDFGELVFRRGLPHLCIIRFFKTSEAERVAAMHKLIERHSSVLDSDH